MGIAESAVPAVAPCSHWGEMKSSDELLKNSERKKVYNLKKKRFTIGCPGNGESPQYPLVPSWRKSA
jgi:hypothetical protein